MLEIIISRPEYNRLRKGEKIELRRTANPYWERIFVFRKREDTVRLRFRSSDITAEYGIVSIRKTHGSRDFKEALDKQVWVVALGDVLKPFPAQERKTKEE